MITVANQLFRVGVLTAEDPSDFYLAAVAAQVAVKIVGFPLDLYRESGGLALEPATLTDGVGPLSHAEHSFT